MQIVSGASWHAMVPALASSMREELRSPFATGRVIADSPATARLLSQAVAAHEGISAGVEYTAPRGWLRGLAREAGAGEAWDAWHSSRLVTAVLEELGDLSRDHAVLARHLSDPRRRLSTAARFARLLRAYVEDAPGTVDAWLRHEEEGGIPSHLAWQPELLRRACETVGFDPPTLRPLLVEAAGRDRTPSWWFDPRRVAAAYAPALLASHPVHAWFVGEAPSWCGHLPQPEPAALGAGPEIALHGSHSRLRQAQVLRDELLRAFSEDPSLEPRDVVVVCPKPAEWASVLNAVFRGDESHPANGLRVAEVAPDAGGNLALEAVLHALELIDGRATATQGLDFLLHPAIAHRWDLAGRRDDLLTLVRDARISWGLDSADRERQGLGGVEQGTWLRGLDALLTGVALGPEVGPLGLTGVGTTTSSDLALIGSLSEILSRLRFLTAGSEDRLTVPAWCEWASEALEQLVGLPFEDAWMVRAASAVCERLARSHASSTLTLDRREFRRLLAGAMPSVRHRPGIGNGDLHVVTPGELSHVDLPLKAFVGITDRLPGGQPDEVPGLLPDDGLRAHQDLLAHARSAGRLIVVTQARSERTGEPRELPVTITRLMQELGVRAEPVVHPPQPFNASAFGASPSFDAPAFAGALAWLRGPGERGVEQRRAEALTRPVADEHHTITLTELYQHLVDPLKSFLRAAAGVQRFSVPEVSDELPLALTGLDRWQLSDALLDGLLQGESPAGLRARALGSQALPPDALGSAIVAENGRLAEQLATQAERFRGGTPHLERVSLDLGRVQLGGAVAMHGTVIAKASPSGGAKALLAGWLELLAMAAAGQQAEAKIVRPKRQRAQVTTLRQPPQDVARGLLELYARSYSLGRHRLVPAPFDPAFRLAVELDRGWYRPEEWLSPAPGAFKKWLGADPLWHLFYDDPTRGFLLDPAQPEDPEGAGSSGFERWARTLYTPMVDFGGTL